VAGYQGQENMAATRSTLKTYGGFLEAVMWAPHLLLFILWNYF
jgi:hypothetical protein